MLELTDGDSHAATPDVNSGRFVIGFWKWIVSMHRWGSTLRRTVRGNESMSLRIKAEVSSGLIRVPRLVEIVFNRFGLLPLRDSNRDLGL